MTKLFAVDESKVRIILHSSLCFISAFILAKGLIGLGSLIVIQYFSAGYKLDNFDLVCIENANSSIWCHKSVISINSIGFLTALFIALASFVFYKWTKEQNVIINLWFLWLYVIALNLSLGKLFVDVIFKRELYHALNWMYIPYQFMYAFSVPSLVLLCILISYCQKRFIRIVRSQKRNRNKNRNRKSQHNKYPVIAIFPAMIGSTFLLLFHVSNIHIFEVLEMTLIPIALFLSYAFVWNRGKNIN